MVATTKGGGGRKGIVKKQKEKMGKEGRFSCVSRKIQTNNAHLAGKRKKIFFFSTSFTSEKDTFGSLAFSFLSFLVFPSFLLSSLFLFSFLISIFLSSDQDGLPLATTVMGVGCCCSCCCWSSTWPSAAAVSVVSPSSLLSITKNCAH